METIKVDQNYSANHDATMKNAAGQTVSAKDVLCAELPAALLALQAGQALTKNIFVSFAIGMVMQALQALGAAFCTGTTAK